MRGGKPRSKRADKLILMKILEVDLIWLRETKEINGNTLISEVNEISVREFSRWCRERALLEDTIKKLIEGGIQKVTHFRDLNRKVLERNKIMPAQIEVIMGVIGREFQQGQRRRENPETATDLYCSNLAQELKLTDWNDSNYNFVSWLEGIEWKLRLREPDPSRWLYYVLPLMTGKAQEKSNEYLKIKPHPSYTEYREFIINKMDTSLEKRKLLNEIRRLRYELSASPIEYVRKKAHLEHLYDPKLTDSQISHIIFEGLPPSIRNQLSGWGKTATLEEIIEIVEDINNERQRRSLRRSQFGVANQRPMINQGQTKDDKRSTDKVMIKKQTSADIKCYRCGQTGHFARNCKENTSKSMNCDQEEKIVDNTLRDYVISTVHPEKDHLYLSTYSEDEDVEIGDLFETAEEQYLSKNREEKVHVGYEVDQLFKCDTVMAVEKDQRNASKSPILNIEYEDEQVRTEIPAILDTGAQLSIVGQNIAKRLNWEITPFDITLTGINGPDNLIKTRGYVNLMIRPEESKKEYLVQLYVRTKQHIVRERFH